MPVKLFNYSRLNYSVIANAGVAQLIEHQPSKLRVASLNLVSRSLFSSGIKDEINS